MREDASGGTPEAVSPSPELPQTAESQRSTKNALNTALIAFPFSGSAKSIRTFELLSRLPPKEEAWGLAEAYYRYCAWQ